MNIILIFFLLFSSVAVVAGLICALYIVFADLIDVDNPVLWTVVVFLIFAVAAVSLSIKYQVI